MRLARYYLRLMGVWVNVPGLIPGPWTVAGDDVELVPDGRGGFLWRSAK